MFIDYSMGDMAILSNVSHGSTYPAQPAAALLSNAGRVLATVMKEPGATMREIGHRCHKTERAVWQLLLELERAGFLQRYRHGRRNRYEVNLSAVASQLEGEGALLLALGILGWEPNRHPAQVSLPASLAAAGNGRT